MLHEDLYDFNYLSTTYFATVQTKQNEMDGTICTCLREKGNV
jgi:hypothetical protein